jgi:uncharacterized membrane protein YedE/YeeE
MNKNEMKDAVKKLLSAGERKADVFSKLSGKGISDDRLAFLIASYPDPILLKRHKTKVNILIIIMFIQAVIALFFGFGIGAKIGPNARWIVGFMTMVIPLFFAWLFYKNFAGAYSAYVLLSLVQIPKQLEGFFANPTATLIGLTTSLVLIFYVWYVRSKVFPDFHIASPRKINKRYVFKERLIDR